MQAILLHLEFLAWFKELGHILNSTRTDIACRSELCFEGCSHKTEEGGVRVHIECKISILYLQESSKLATLPSDTTHYLIPFTDVATKFMEVIEFDEISGVIFPQTVVNQIQQSSLKHYRCFASILRSRLWQIVLSGEFAVTSETSRTVQSFSQMSSSR